MNRIERIGVTWKRSKLEWDMFEKGLSQAEMLEHYREEDLDVDRIIASHDRQRRNIELLMGDISEAEIIDLLDVERGRINPNVDLLFAIGGDNFFQRCTHQFADSYLVGVNSDVRTSFGAILNFDYDSVHANLDRILKGDFNAEYWSRISTSFNGHKIEDTTCTLSLSIKATDMISRYQLRKGDESEEQKSTGLLLATGAGSGLGAWYRNAGLYLPMVGATILRDPETKVATSIIPGPYQPLTSFSHIAPEFRTVTREPFKADLSHYRWLNLKVSEGEELSLRYWSVHPSELSIDSINRYEVKEGDMLKFRVSEKPLKIVGKY
ncbi:MAG: hypothetical protein WCV90_01095 [Candidatus Woesearchaeota archaeon]|jgi:NAD kinase